VSVRIWKPFQGLTVGCRHMVDEPWPGYLNISVVHQNAVWN